MKPRYTLYVVAAVLFLVSCSKDLSFEGGYIPAPTKPGDSLSINPPADTPAVDTPIIDTPIVDTPIVDTPIIDTPIVDPPIPPMSDEERLKKLLLSGDFKLVAFYSDIPIDYSPNVPGEQLETDLWPYMAPWLIDDVFDYTETQVIITQNSVKRPQLNTPTVTRNYSVGTDQNGVYIIFLDYLYNPLTYRVTEIGDDYYIVAVPGPDGSMLHTRFEKL